MMLTAAQNLVRYALSIGAIKLLSEGKKLISLRASPYYYEIESYCTGEALTKLASAYVFAITNQSQPPSLIFGPPSKNLNMAPVVALHLDRIGVNVSFATMGNHESRPDANSLVIGASLKNAKVTIVDDVITTGESTTRAINFVKNHGGEVVSIIMAFDRQETIGRSKRSALQIFQEKTNIPVHALANLDDLIVVLEKNMDFPGYTPDTLTAIKEYKKRYGVK